MNEGLRYRYTLRTHGEAEVVPGLEQLCRPIRT